MHATSEQLQSYNESSELEMKDGNNWMSVKTPGSACPLTTCGQSNLHIDLDDCCCTWDVLGCAATAAEWVTVAAQAPTAEAALLAPG